MKNILILNDGSAQAGLAVKLAGNIAQLMDAEIVMVNVKNIKARPKVLANGRLAAIQHAELADTVPETGSMVVSEHIDATAMTEHDIAQVLIKRGAIMFVNGLGEDSRLNVHAILNKVQCPLLMLPRNYKVDTINRITYMADLRYCQLPVVKYLASMARLNGASVHVAHLSLNGLPHMNEDYALEVFEQGISQYVKYDKLKYSNTFERDLQKATDVIVNTMNTDMLALVNHQYHFNEVLKGKISALTLNNINIPVLLFPC